MLGLLECALARTGELHAALEVAQRVVQRQVALLELVDDRFQLGKRAFEVHRGFGDRFGGGGGFAGHDRVRRGKTLTASGRERGKLALADRAGQPRPFV